MTRQSALLLFSSAFGILMVVTAVRPAGPMHLAVLGLSTAALLAGLFVRQAAAAAVLICVAAMAVADPTPLFAALSGLSAAVYLVLRYAVSSGVRGFTGARGSASDAVTMTMPTVVGMVGFTLVGLTASLLDLELAWVPLLAPLIAVTILVVVALPLWADERTGYLPAAEPEPERPA